MNSYQLNTLIQLQATFKGANGVVADPTAVSVSIRTPDDVINDYSPTRVSVGVYTYDVLLNQPGPWIYNWQGTGVVEITSGDVYLQVQRSAILS